MRHMSREQKTEHKKVAKGYETTFTKAKNHLENLLSGAAS